MFSFFQLSAQDELFSSIRNGDISKVKTYINSQPQAVNLLSKEGFSPLILAAYSGNLEMVQLLAYEGAAINHTSPMGTALMAAIVKNHFPVVQFLLEKGADVNLSDENGTTPLIFAVQFKNPEIIKLLLNYKPDFTHIDKAGKTAFEYAVFSGDEVIIQLLK
jgi:ankyrin repeat protein